jgi:putative transcriptional regulator
MPIRMRIGELARAHGLTIKALAERAGVAYNTAHALYTSRATRIDLDTLDRMCDALQVQPGDIFVRHTVYEYDSRQHEHGVDLDWASGIEDRPAAPPS